MNSLSWMIYLADVAGSISITLGIITGAGILGGVVSIMAFAIGDDPLPSAKTAAIWLFSAALVARLLAAPVPEAGTIYAIAASEVGEKALASKTAGKAMQALDAWLDKQITPTKAP